MDATTVHLDGNNMGELINPGFIGRRRIHTVFLNNSQIRVVTNFSLEGLTEVSQQIVRRVKGIFQNRNINKLRIYNQ